MSRRIVPLAPEHLARAGPPCRDCVAWEASPAERRRLDGAESGCARLKADWVRAVRDEWGTCGFVVLHDEDVVGHVLYAPAALVPGATRFATSPASTDAVLLTSLRVLTAHRGHGLGRVLVQHVARDLVRRGGYRALEAFASAEGSHDDQGCLVPVDVLLRAGFTVQRAHPRTPRLRLDLRSTVRWRTGLEAALGRLRAGARPAPAARRRPGPARSSRGWSAGLRR